MDSLRQPMIAYDPTPTGDPYNSVSQENHGGFFPIIFSYSSYLTKLLGPNQLPIDVAVAYMEGKLPPNKIIEMILLREPVMTAFLALGSTIGCLIPLLGFAVCFCKYSGRCKNGCGSSISSGGQGEERCGFCCRRILSSVVISVTILVGIGLTLLIASHDTLKVSSQVTRKELRSNIKDLEIFMRNSNLQLKFVIRNSYKKTTDAFLADLDGIEYVLGRTLQRDLGELSQLDEAMHSLVQISDGFRGIGGRLSTLEKLRLETSEQETEANIRLEIIRKDLARLLNSCSLLDQLHCQTIDSDSMQLKNSFKNISFSKFLNSVQMVEFKNLSETSRQIRNKFENIPSYIEQKTVTKRKAIKMKLTSFESNLEEKLRSLDELSYDSRKMIRQMDDQVEVLGRGLDKLDPIIQYMGWGLAGGIGLIGLSLLNVTMCLCCFPTKDDQKPSGPQKLTAYSLTSSVTLVFFLSFFLWFLSLSVLFLGVQVNTFLCAPLHEEPNFKILSLLLDSEGLMYPSGFLNKMFSSLEQDLKVKHILSECLKDEALYNVLKLQSIVNVDKDLNIENQLQLKKELESFKLEATKINLTNLESEKSLDSFLNSLDINLSRHHQQLEQPLTDMNFKSFVTNMQRVASQLESMDTSAALFRLATKSRNFLRNFLDPLQNRKNDMIYQMTSLESDVIPLQRKIKGSVDHLRKFHNVLRIKGQTIIDNKLLEYTIRLMSYLTQHEEHLRNSFSHEVAKCGPVWNTFDSARETICSVTSYPINSLWISSIFCLLLFIPLLYVNLNLSNIYLQSHWDDGLTNNRYRNQNGSQVTFPSVQPTGNLWVTPGTNRRIQQPQDSSIHPRYDQVHRERVPMNHHSEDSHYNIMSTCPPNCQHHVTAQTSNVVLPHLMHSLRPLNAERDSQLHSPNIRRSRDQHHPSERYDPRKTRSSQRVLTSHELSEETIPERDNCMINQDAEIEALAMPTDSNYEGLTEWQGNGSDVVAMAQVTAWREAALAGADFVTPEFVAIQVRKTPSWVKKFWDLDPKSIAKKFFRTKDNEIVKKKHSFMCN